MIYPLFHTELLKLSHLKEILKQKKELCLLLSHLVTFYAGPLSIVLGRLTNKSSITLHFKSQAND